MTQLRVVEYMTARRRPILRSESDIAYRLYTCNGRRVCVAAAPVDQLSASRTRFPRNGLKPYSNDLAKQLSNVELAMFSNLHTLNLANHDGFEHASLEFVSCITALQYLTLDKCRPPEWTPVFKSISQLSRLCSLSLRGCGFLESDLVHLQNLVSLQALDLNACRGVTNQGLQNVVNLTRLLRLNLSCTSVTDLKPVRGLTCLRDLNLLCSNCFNDATLATIASLTSLSTLVMPTQHDRIQPSLLKDLTNLQNLESLQLSSLTKVCCAWTSNLVSLRSLEINVTHINHIGFDYLSGIRMLTHLSLCCDVHSRQHFATLGSNVTLQSLKMVVFMYTDSDVTRLSTLTALRHLEIQVGNEASLDLVHFSSLHALERLKLLPTYGNRTSGLVHMSALSNLRHLEIGGIVSEDLALVPAFTQLSVLRLNSDYLVLNYI